MAETSSETHHPPRPDDSMGCHDGSEAPDGGALPNTVIIGAMKCGTSALHRYLDCHPDIAMSRPKELNFFFDPPTGGGALAHRERQDQGQQDGYAWSPGNWHRGLTWYARHFPSAAPVRGESSPGYTSPSHPDVAQRMATVIPGTRLVYVVRDPVERAVSQYRHHRGERAERRPPEEALLDPDSQYVSRGRYHDRLVPFLRCFGRDQIAIVSREELLTQRRSTLRALFGFLGADERFWSSDFLCLWHSSNGQAPRLGSRLRSRLIEALRDDADRLRQLAGRDFPGWSV